MNSHILDSSVGKFNKIEKLGEFFYHELEKSMPSEDIDLFIKVLENNRINEKDINSQVLGCIQQLIFTIMLLYGEEITKEKINRNKIKDTLKSEISKIYSYENETLEFFINEVINTYKEIKNNTFKKKNTSSRKRLFTRNILDRNKELYFLLEEKVIRKRKLWWGYKIISKKTDEELRELCINKFNSKIKNLEMLKEYTEKHLF